MTLQTQPAARPVPRVERRRHHRVLYGAPIRLHCLMPGGVRTCRGIALDISEGGMGALVQNNLMVGEAVEIDLQLPRSSLSAVAIVRHASTGRSGFEFLGLTPEERQQIASVMSSK
jgi:c-di-GMP-binding flagellar brake protein YcgR